MSIHIVTGAFGYSGRYITARLVADGVTVRTLTDSPNRPHPFGDGGYRLQPIYVDDLAELAVREGRSRESQIIDAVGPETFSFRELVDTIGRIIERRRPVVSVSPMTGYFAAWVLGKLVSDVMLTREEIAGLMQNLLYTTSKAAGKTKLTEWAQAHASELGMRYSSELARRRKRSAAYRV